MKRFALKTYGSTESTKQQQDLVAEHLKTFDELDYDVFSSQKWDRLSESHADDSAPRVQRRVI